MAQTHSNLISSVPENSYSKKAIFLEVQEDYVQFKLNEKLPGLVDRYIIVYTLLLRLS